MAVNKINGFAAPYRASTFQKLATSQLGRNGILAIADAVSETGGEITVPPFTFIQNGLIIEKDVETVVSTPSISGAYHVVVHAPTSANTDDLIFTFAKSPDDLSASEVVIASYDGSEWSNAPILSIDGVSDGRADENVQTGRSGVYKGLKTTDAGSAYENGVGDDGVGALVDKQGVLRKFNTAQQFTKFADDADYFRVDRVVYRRPVDAESRIGERKLLLGCAFGASNVAIHTGAFGSSTTVKTITRVVVGTNNQGYLLSAVGYGTSYSIRMQRISSDRTTTFGSYLTLITDASDPNFDAAVDSTNIVHVVYASGDNILHRRFDIAGTALTSVPVDTQTGLCRNPRMKLGPDEEAVYITYQCLMGTSNNQIFFTSQTLLGAVITAPVNVTGTATNLANPDLFITPDFYLYITWQNLSSGAIQYRRFTNFGTAAEALATVSTGIEQIGVGTLTDGGKNPRIWVTDNKKVFIAFLQNKGSSLYGLTLWSKDDAFMKEIIASNENFTHFDFYVDDVFNHAHFILGRSNDVNYVKLAGRALSLTVNLSAQGTQGVALAFDKVGTFLHTWTDPASGTFTDYDTGVAVEAIGPVTFDADGTPIPVAADQVLLAGADLGTTPLVGERITLSGSGTGGNNVSKIITDVDVIVVVDGYALVTVDSDYAAGEDPSPAVAALAAPTGNSVFSSKTVAGTETEGMSTDEMEEDILLSRIVSNAAILNRAAASGRPGSFLDYIIPFGPATVDWGATTPGELTIGSGLKILDIFTNTEYAIEDGGYAMLEGDALYVTLDGSDLTPTPVVAQVPLVPWDAEVAVIGVIKGGRFVPALLAGGDFDQLDDGESFEFGSDLPSAVRARLGIVSDTSFQAYTSAKTIATADTYPQALSKLDLVASQNPHVRLNRFNASWGVTAANSLVFLAQTTVQVPGIAENRNQIAAQTISLPSDGDVAYITLNRSGSGADTRTVSVAAISVLTVTGDTFIIARNVGGDLLIGDELLVPGTTVNTSVGDAAQRVVNKVAAVSLTDSSLPSGASFATDGYTAVNGDRFLFGHTSLNGIYQIRGVGTSIAFTKVKAFSGTDTPSNGDLVASENGSAWNKQLWIYNAAETKWHRLAETPSELQEDRSAYLRSDEEVEWDGSQLTFTSDIILEVLNTKSGTLQTHTVQASNSPIAIANNEAIWVEIDRTVNSENLTVKRTTVDALPALTHGDKDIFVLFKRKDTAGSDKMLHLPLLKQTMVEGQRSVLGASGSGGVQRNTVTLTDGQSTAADIDGFKVDDTKGDRGFTAEYSIQRYRIPASIDRTALNNALATSGGFNNSISDIQPQPDGKFIVGGAFTSWAGNTNRKYLMRFNADGTEDTSFNNNISSFGSGTGFNSPVDSIGLMDDGKIVLAGQFSSWGGNADRRFLIRLNADGSDDSTFNTTFDSFGTGAGLTTRTTRVIVQPDQKILVCGLFTAWGGNTNRSRFIRINSDGTDDSTFNNNFDGYGDGSGLSNSVQDMGLHPDGKILLSGDITSYGGDTTKKYLIAVNSDGTEDTTFNTNFQAYGNGIGLLGATVNYTSCMAFQEDGKILLAGHFTSWGNDGNRRYFIRINEDGTDDPDFNSTFDSFGSGAGLNNSARAVMVQDDGKILVGGQFTSWGGNTSREYLIRLNTDGTEDTTFNNSLATFGDSSGINGSVLALAQRGRVILVGGLMASWGGNTSRESLFGVSVGSYERVKQGSIRGLYRPLTDTWELGGEVSMGDDPGVELSITSAGQVQYTSTSIGSDDTEVDEINFAIIKT